jgi:hypothetical protein
MKPLPHKATGTHPLVQTVNTIIDCLREREIIPGTTTEVHKTSQGTRIEAKGGSSGGKSPEDEDLKIPRWG